MKHRLLVRLRRTGKTFFDVVTHDQIRTGILEAIPFWLAALLTGIIAVLYAKIFNLSEDILNQLLNWHRWTIFIIAPLNFLLAWYTVKLIAINAKGSGIPQVMAAIDLSSPNYEKGVSRLLGFKIILAKIASSTLMIIGGGAIGREGPTIQIAGSVFHLVNKHIPSSWSKLSQKSFILTGAAAGLAAAFNTPLGGIVFAIEELAKIHISLFRTALFTSVIIAGLTAQALLGPYLYLGYPDVANIDTSMFIGTIACSLLAGLAGSMMCKLILRILTWKQRFTLIKSIMIILFIGIVTASIAYFINDQILGSGKEIMNQLLFTDKKHVTWQTMLARIFGPILSFSVGGAGGIFAPSLAAGATIGGFISSLFGMAGANANILILAGMVGFLTGVTRTPFTSAILVLEMTDRHSVIFYLMLAALISNIAATFISKHSFYEQLKGEYLQDAKRHAG